MDGEDSRVWKEGCVNTDATPTRAMTIPEIVEAVNQRVEEFRKELIADIEGVIAVNDEQARE